MSFSPGLHNSETVSDTLLFSLIFIVILTFIPLEQRPTLINHDSHHIFLKNDRVPEQFLLRLFVLQMNPKTHFKALTDAPSRPMYLSTKGIVTSFSTFDSATVFSFNRLSDNPTVSGCLSTN